MKTFSDFTNLYPLSKTLRFELVPVGATKANIERDGICEVDSKIADDYKKMKRLIDEYHKLFIEKTLSSLVLNETDLQSCINLYQDKAKNNEFEKAQQKLRKQIAKQFSKVNKKAFDILFKKELIRDELGKHLSKLNVEGFSQKDKEMLIEEFCQFTTYFRGFNKNRKNMYTDEAKSTAIAYRLVNDNLPRFIDNMAIFSKLKEVGALCENLQQVEKDFKQHLSGVLLADVFKPNFYTHLLTQSQITIYNTLLGGKTEAGRNFTKGINVYIESFNQTQSDKANKLPMLKPLYKQILSDREQLSWLPEKFSDDQEVLAAVNSAYKLFFVDGYPLAKQLKELLAGMGTFDLAGIFVSNDTSLTAISQRVTGSWQTITSGMKAILKLQSPKSPKKSNEKYEEKIDKIFKNMQCVSLAEINAALKTEHRAEDVASYFTSLGAIDKGDTQEINHFAKMKMPTLMPNRCLPPTMRVKTWRKTMMLWRKLKICLMRLALSSIS